MFRQLFTHKFMDDEDFDEAGRRGIRYTHGRHPAPDFFDSTMFDRHRMTSETAERRGEAQLKEGLSRRAPMMRDLD